MPTPMLYHSQARAAIERSLLTAKPIVDSDRQSRAATALGYDRSIKNQIDDLTTFYLAQYDLGDGGQEQWRAQPKAAYNLTRRVGDELCTLYHDPITLSWQAGDSQWETGFQDFPWWNRRLALVDRKTFYGGGTFVRPYVLEAGGPTKLAIYTADQIDVTYSPDDPDEVWQVVLTWTLGQGDSLVTHRLFLTADQVLWTADDVIVKDEDYPDGKHPYGRIPGVFFHNGDVSEGVIGEPADDLVIANRTINRGVTMLNDTVDMQGAATLVTVMGDETKKPKVGPRRRINIPNPEGSASFLAPNAPIDAVISAANFNLSLMCKARGIPDDAFLVQRQGDSGVAIVSRRASLIDYRKRRAETFRTSEQELIQLALLVRELHTLRRAWNGITLPPAPGITYTIPRMPMDDAERSDAEMEIRQGVISPADLVMRKRPELKREEAEKIIRDNKAFASSLEMTEVPFGTETEGDDDAAA